MWGKRAETLAPMLLKGSRIGVTGELTNRPYTANDGTEKHSLELRVIDVTLLGKPTESAGTRKESEPKDPMDWLDDDIPF